MPNFADRLNFISEPLFQAVHDGYIPFEYLLLTEGLTGFDSNNIDAIALNPPVAGLYNDLSREPGWDISLQPVGDRFILRGIIGYSMAAYASHNRDLFTLRISNVINSMLGAAYKVYGPRVISLTFDRPGAAGEYFREMEYNAGYELRLHGILRPVETRFEMETVE